MISKSKRFSILARDKFRCCYCGASPKNGAILQLDHVLPASQGGGEDEDNLLTACMDCNNGKRNRTIAQAISDVDCRWRARSAMNGVIDAMLAYTAALRLDMIEVLRQHGVSEEAVEGFK